MALPANVNFGTVTGVITRAVDDGTDTGRNPDGIPVRGLRFTFTADLNPSIVRNVSATPPVMIQVMPITAITDDDGVLCAKGDGLPGVELVASVDPDLDPNGWSWTATVDSTSFPMEPFSFTVSPGQVIDLTTVIRVPANPGAEVIQWQAAVADTLANKVAAQTAATNAASSESAAAASLATLNTSKGAANGIAPLDAGALLPDANVPTRLSATSLNATMDGKIAADIPRETAAIAAVARRVDMLTEGAVANGTTDDLAVFSAARTKAGVNGIVHFAARPGAAVTKYLLGTSRPDLSGTQISADPTVIIKVDANPNIRDWKLLTPVTIENPVHATTIRKPAAVDLRSIEAMAANVMPQKLDLVAENFTTWTAFNYAGNAPGVASAATSTVTADFLSWGTSFASGIQGLTVAPVIGVLYEVLADSIGTNGSAWQGPAIISADLYLAGLTNYYNATSTARLTAPGFMATAKTIPVTVTNSTPSAVGGITYGIRLTSLRTAEFYYNGRLIDTMTTLKDITGVGVMVNGTESGSKYFSHPISYRGGFQPGVAQQVTCSVIGDSITYGAWSPVTWPELLPISYHGLPGGGQITVRQNLAVSSTSTLEWGVSGAVYDVAQYSFAGDQYVLVMLGTNDAQAGVGPTAYKDRLTYIANDIVSKGAVPVFCVFPVYVAASISGVTGVTTTNALKAARYRATVARFAAVGGYPLALVNNSFGDAWKWYGDNIHPDAIGQAAIAKAFAQAIARHRSPVMM